MQTRTTEKRKFLRELLPPSCTLDPLWDNIIITGLALDSRKVQFGDLFVAISGVVRDGSEFIEKAVQAGAVAVIAESGRPENFNYSVPYIRVDNARKIAAFAASHFFDKQPEYSVAVTGTSGKSSVVEFYRQLVSLLGFEGASLGTIGITRSSGAVYGSLTTPDPISLHQILNYLAEDGVTHLALEASSHGIEQHRLDEVHLEAAGFTNIGRDHLDYHKTIEVYVEAKLKLFSDILPKGKTAVINADGAYAERFLETAQKHGQKVISVGKKGQTIRVENIELHGFSQKLSLMCEEELFDVHLNLPGDFQCENVLVAVGLVKASCPDVPYKDLLNKIPLLRGVPGRLEKVAVVNDALCIVDYAHKPDALEHVLNSLRSFTPGRLICIFGCGGDRDKGKRPIMGRIASEKADIVIVTDDNPRSEDPAVIRSEVLAGTVCSVRNIGDRSLAIHEAISLLKQGDVLVVAGKGHETGQIVGDESIPFSDKEEILKAIAEMNK